MTITHRADVLHAPTKVDEIRLRNRLISPILPGQCQYLSAPEAFYAQLTFYASYHSK